MTPEAVHHSDSEARDSNTVLGEPIDDEQAPPQELDEEEMAQAVGNFVEALAQREPPLPPLQDDDMDEEEAQDVEPMGDDDMDGALEGRF